MSQLQLDNWQKVLQTPTAKQIDPIVEKKSKNYCIISAVAIFGDNSTSNWDQQELHTNGRVIKNRDFIAKKLSRLGIPWKCYETIARFYLFLASIVNLDVCIVRNRNEFAFLIKFKT